MMHYRPRYGKLERKLNFWIAPDRGSAGVPDDGHPKGAGDLVETPVTAGDSLSS